MFSFSYTGSFKVAKWLYTHIRPHASHMIHVFLFMIKTLFPLSTTVHLFQNTGEVTFLQVDILKEIKCHFCLVFDGNFPQLSEETSESKWRDRQLA